MILVRRLLVLGSLVCACSATPLYAAPLSINFCPGDATCPAGVLEASLTFTEIVNSDPNDYVLDITIKGGSNAPAYVDELSFSLSGVQTPGGYEYQPTLVSAPGGGAPWVVYWDNVSASVKSCTSDTTSSQEVCTQSGPGTPTNFGAPLPGQTLVWEYVVDLAGSAPLGTQSVANLRAQFLNSNGSNAGILSPGGGTLTQVPEPSTLLVSGVGFLFAAALMRRRKNT